MSSESAFLLYWQTSCKGVGKSYVNGHMHSGSSDDFDDRKIDSWKMESGTLILESPYIKGQTVVSSYEYINKDCIIISSPDGKAKSYYYRK